MIPHAALLALVNDLLQRYSEMEEEEIEIVTNDLLAIFPTLAESIRVLLKRDALMVEALEEYKASCSCREAQIEDRSCNVYQKHICQPAELALSRLSALPLPPLPHE